MIMGSGVLQVSMAAHGPLKARWQCASMPAWAQAAMIRHGSCRAALVAP